MMAQSGFEQDTFKALLDNHLAQMNQGDVLQKFRAKAWDRFLELGLPDRRTEVYRYIKLRHLFSQSYQLAETVALAKEEIQEWVYPECQQSVLVFVNGNYHSHLSNTQAIPTKVSISTLEEATRTYSAFLNNHWTKSIKEEKDPFASLNSVLQRDGLFIYVPPKTVIETPIQVLHVLTDLAQPTLLFPRLNVFVGSQSQVNVFSTQKVMNTTAYCVNQVTEFTLEEESHVQYTQVLCDEQPAAWHLDAFRAHLKKNATLKTVAITKGSATVRNDYQVTLAGENAEALLNGVWMLGDKREAHVNVLVEHQAPNCRSYQLFKGVLNDFSRSSFEGKILVRQLAQKTQAFQLNNNLILHDHAHADSKPNLEIFADDVKASHGATVGQLDADQLFYLTTRGISAQEAKNLLVYGFCEQVIDLITLPSLKNTISNEARRYLTKG